MVWKSQSNKIRWFGVFNCDICWQQLINWDMIFIAFIIPWKDIPTVLLIPPWKQNSVQRKQYWGLTKYFQEHYIYCQNIWNYACDTFFKFHITLFSPLTDRKYNTHNFWNHTHLKVGHNSEFLLGINWWTWKITIY